MNERFRDAVFGRSFNLNLRETQVKHLIRIINAVSEDDRLLLSMGYSPTTPGLERRGLIELRPSKTGQYQVWYPTKAGLLVYDLLAEAGECRSVDSDRRRLILLADRVWKMEAQSFNENMGSFLEKAMEVQD